MPILALSEAKLLLQIPLSKTDDDPLLAEVIRRAQARVIRYCNNNFATNAIQVYGDGITFDGSTRKILDPSDMFVEMGFADGMDVAIRGSNRNDGVKTVKTASSGYLTLETFETVYTETPNRLVIVSFVKWPFEIGFPTSILLRYYLEKAGKLVSQEQLPGGYSVTYKSEDEVLKMFNAWRRPN